mmetsp:Transcript_15781/g.48854  ORF Transcript_15781/g.48854 Transcript_15781/m.48854 type:complete len:244 (-) Transcript_15781:2483-3214(-)
MIGRHGQVLQHPELRDGERQMFQVVHREVELREGREVAEILRQLVEAVLRDVEELETAQARKGPRQLRQEVVLQDELAQLLQVVDIVVDRANFALREPEHAQIPERRREERRRREVVHAQFEDFEPGEVKVVPDVGVSGDAHRPRDLGHALELQLHAARRRGFFHDAADPLLVRRLRLVDLVRDAHLARDDHRHGAVDQGPVLLAAAPHHRRQVGDGLVRRVLQRVVEDLELLQRRQEADFVR